MKMAKVEPVERANKTHLVAILLSESCAKNRIWGDFVK
jgi:hypothetical protein